MIDLTQTTTTVNELASDQIIKPNAIWRNGTRPFFLVPFFVVFFLPSMGPLFVTGKCLDRRVIHQTTPRASRERGRRVLTAGQLSFAEIYENVWHSGTKIFSVPSMRWKEWHSKKKANESYLQAKSLAWSVSFGWLFCKYFSRVSFSLECSLFLWFMFPLIRILRE